MKSGWSLPELLLACLLGGVVLLIVSGTLASTSKLTRLESQRGFAMGQLQSSLAQIQSILQRSCSAGVSYQAPPPAGVGVLAVHLQDPASYVTTPLWQPNWTCLTWNTRQQELRQFLCPPIPGAIAAPRTSLPQAATPAELTLMAAASGRQRRLLASDVTYFDYSLLVGPVAQISLELEIDVGRQHSEKVRLFRKIYFRNRI
jgi:hypothetical protein